MSQYRSDTVEYLKMLREMQQEVKRDWIETVATVSTPVVGRWFEQGPNLVGVFRIADGEPFEVSVYKPMLHNSPQAVVETISKQIADAIAQKVVIPAMR
jgi:hypothetical protein